MKSPSFSSFCDSCFIDMNESSLTCDEWIELNIKTLKQAYDQHKKMLKILEEVKK